MSWLQLPRKPETEIMSNADEAAAYTSAAAQRYLESLDNSLVEQVESLWPGGGAPKGRLLDIGCGPGGIPLKLAQHAPDLRVAGVDGSPVMIQLARRAAVEQSLATQAHFFRCDASHLCFADATFDFVLSNSVLHHLADPIAVFQEMARVVKKDGLILVRDLRRPSRLAFPLHVWWHGRYYSGLMKKLYRDSVGAAYTPRELSQLLRRSHLADSRIFLRGRTHMDFLSSRDNRSGSGVEIQ